VDDSGLGAAAIVLGAPFSLNPENETKIAYNGEGGKICIRTKSGLEWSSNVQCVEGANPKNESPLSMLDWLGGPSIYFFTNDNRLSGIDYIPKTDNWRLSTIMKENITVHNVSQIASATWRNGAGAWLYYQVPNKQIWEFGMDDYRDQIWRNSSNGGSMGDAVPGSGIGVTRWINQTEEVEEMFFEVASGVIQGKMYAHKVWITDTYSIDGTADNIREGSGITATTVKASTGDMILLAYIAKNDFLEVQTRGTMNGTTFSAFSSPNKIVEGNGHPRTGVAAVDSSGMPMVYLVNGRKIVEMSSNNSSAKWTNVDI